MNYFEIRKRLYEHRILAPKSNVAKFLRALRNGNKHFLIVDLKFNTRSKDSGSIPGQDRIIQVGMCLLNSKLQIEATRRIYIDPYPDKISGFATKLTGISQDKIDAEGKFFLGACSELFDLYERNDTIIMSYSSDSIQHLESEMLKFHASFRTAKWCNWKEDWLDVESIAQSLLGSKQWSFEHILSLLDLDSLNTPYDAESNSRNTKAVLRKLFGWYIAEKTEKDAKKQKKIERSLHPYPLSNLSESVWPGRTVPEYSVNMNELDTFFGKIIEVYDASGKKNNL